MRKLLPLPVCLLLIYGAVLIGVGCGSGCQSANQSSYRATGTAVVTVDAAMQAWGSYVAKNHPGTATEQKVADAYKKYQQSVNLVADAAIAFSKSKAANDTALPAAQANLNAVIAASATALSDLEGLIVSFGAKL